MTACPSCGESVPPTARYCEACGAELTPDIAAPSPAAAAGGPAGCASCGAPASQIGEDGYCGQCGMKQPAPGDHRELELSAIAAVTDRGLHHHRNEDAFAIAEVDVGDFTALVVVVCDGVSSTSDSDLAAQGAAIAACDTLRAAVTRDPTALAARTVDAVAAAQAAASRVPAKDGETPSSTIVTAIAVRTAERATVVVGWLGDSRVYCIVDGTLRQVSVDDSWAADQIAAGMAEATAYADPQSHTITRWLGADAVDVVPTVETLEIPLGSTLLVCSDGLWNYAPTVGALASVIAERQPASSNLALAQSLTNFARTAGGHDNITVAIASI
ncbi:MAG TPA: PP2C family serine/threonine-protein phosphatase [Acidimicrobiales bacterium]|nr:PP2C family serine/threonine-protein phosphatase [Acidimicrobiales bacterium]